MGENTFASPFTKQISFSTLIRIRMCHWLNSASDELLPLLLGVAGLPLLLPSVCSGGKMLEKCIV